MCRSGEAPGGRKAGPSASASRKPAPALPALSPPRRPPDGQPLAEVPSRPSRCSLCGPRRMPPFISRTPLPFDSPLPSVSANLCVLGIQLEERTERVTASPNPASAPPSTRPAELQAARGLLVTPGPALGFVGISCRGVGLSPDGTRSDAGECHVPVRVEGATLLCVEPSMGTGGKVPGGRVALAWSGLP